MNTKTNIIIGMLLLTVGACTDGETNEDPIEGADVVASDEERMGVEIQSAHFDPKVDLEAQHEMEAFYDEACQVDGVPPQGVVQAPLPVGLTDPHFRVDEDPIQASLAAQEARDSEPLVVGEARAPSDEVLEAQERYLAAAEQLEVELADEPVRLAEAKAELKLAELGE